MVMKKGEIDNLTNNKENIVLVSLAQKFYIIR